MAAQRSGELDPLEPPRIVPRLAGGAHQRGRPLGGVEAELGIGAAHRAGLPPGAAVVAVVMVVWIVFVIGWMSERQGRR